MLSKDLAPESPDEEEQPAQVTVSFRRAVLNEVIRLTLCAVSGGGVSGFFLVLTVLTILTTGLFKPPGPLPT